MNRRFLLVLLVGLLASGLSFSLLAGICDDQCSGSGCDWMGEGGGWQNYYNRCQYQACGNYDPNADDCQKVCEWNTYECDFGWPVGKIECNHITSYDETCITQ